MSFLRGHLGKQTGNTRRVLKCGAGERCRRSVGEMKKCYKETRR